MKVGIGQRDITPELPIELAGMGLGNVAYDIESRLYVKAFTFQKGRSGFSVVTCDLLGIDDDIGEEIENGIRSESEKIFSKYDLFISCSHTHWAPHLRTLWGGCRINAFYRRYYVEKTIEAIVESFGDCETARLYAGQIQCSLNINRRVILDGKAFMLPLYPEFTYRADGPVDHGVNYMLMKKENGVLKGMIFHYACHPICFPGKYDKISSEYPGKVNAMIAERYNIPSGFINGGAGDVASLGALKGEAARNALAEVISERIIQSIDKGDYEELSPDGFDSRRFTSDFMPRGDVIDKRKIERYEKGRAICMPLGFWRIGQWICVTFGGELFTGPEMELKKSLPFKYVNAASYTNGYMGYLPPESSYPEGGYEISAALVEKGSVEKFMLKIRAEIEKSM